MFSDVKVANCKLYVPTGTKDDYMYADGWGYFVNIIEETVINTSDDVQKPTISYENGHLLFKSSTANATFSYTIQSSDITQSLTDSNDGDIVLAKTYNITVYAKLDGKTSSATTATLVWLDARLDDVVTVAKAISVDALPLLISQEDGIVTVTGLTDGETITAYGADGREVAKSKAIGDSALMNLSDLRGKVAVLSVKGRTTKVVIK